MRLTPDGLEMEGEQGFDIRDFNMQPPRVFMMKVSPQISAR